MKIIELRNSKKEKLFVLPSLLFQEIEVLSMKVLTKPLSKIQIIRRWYCCSISGISNNTEAGQKMYQRSQFFAKHLVITQLEKGDNGNDKCHLRPTEIQQSQKNAESFVEASKNLVNLLDVKGNVVAYCIKTGLFLALHI